MKKIKLLSLLTIGLVLFASLSGCKKNDDDDDNNNGGGGNNGPWTELGVGYFNASIFTICLDNQGNLYAAGGFTNSAGKFFVAKWDGIAWTELGNLNVDGTISSICADDAGNIYAVGFTDNNLEAYMAIWNGSSWTYTPTVNELYLYNVITDNNGNVYALGTAQVYKWNGSWEAMSMSGWPHWTNGLLYAQGNLYVAGGALMGGTLGAVGVWNGSGWSYLGDINSYEQAYNLAMDTQGNLYASGGFDFQSGYVLKWNGGSWTDLNLNGNDKVLGLAVSTGDNVYAAGEFANANNKFYMAKWNGTSWSEEGVGNFNSNTLAMCAGSNGKIYLAGNFFRYLNGTNNYFVAVYQE